LLALVMVDFIAASMFVALVIVFSASRHHM
jgi:hypothetical protein